MAASDSAAAEYILERDWRFARLVGAVGIPGPVHPGDPSRSHIPRGAKRAQHGSSM